ncbi:MAG: hypothetical protein COB78_06140 [Hyphomicrobiales bacterium]|nr:MAG: hypothetical protein COB78_06140 [Hyphomicrobiales bacterium]
MDFKYLFTSFDGRIGRQQFWLGILAIVIASFALIIVLGFTIGLFLPTALISLIGTIIIFYPSLALSMKRLHDRNKGAKPWAFIFFGPGILMQLMQITGIGFTTSVIAGEEIVIPSNGLVMIFSVVGAVIGLWALVEFGFLKGTDGDNQFGPDPLKS